MDDKQIHDGYFSPIEFPSDYNADPMNNIDNSLTCDHTEQEPFDKRHRLRDNLRPKSESAPHTRPLCEIEPSTSNQPLDLSIGRFHSTYEANRPCSSRKESCSTELKDACSTEYRGRLQGDGRHSRLGTQSKVTSLEAPVPSPTTSTSQRSRQSLDRSRDCTPRAQISSTSSPRHGSSSTQNSRTKRSLNSSQSSEAVCRICHSSASAEQLFSPCYCSGSIGLLHISCLQRWLGASNKTCCELCNFQFTVQRHPKPFHKFLQNPGSRRDKRHLMCDIGCFIFLAPSTIVTAFMCIVASRTYKTEGIETLMLYCLSLALMILFSVWLTMCVRHNRKMYNKWKCFNQNVKIICEPSTAAVTKSISSTPTGKASLETVKLCSVKIKVSTKSDAPQTRVIPEIHQDVRLTEENLARALTSAAIDKKEPYTNTCIYGSDNLPGPSRSFQSSSSDSRDRKLFRYDRHCLSKDSGCRQATGRHSERLKPILGEFPLPANTYI